MKMQGEVHAKHLIETQGIGGFSPIHDAHRNNGDEQGMSSDQGRKWTNCNN
jgi:hypothetical protein